MWWMVYTHSTDLAWDAPTEWQRKVYPHMMFGRFPLCNDGEELA